MKIGPTTSKDFVAALNTQPAPAIGKSVATLEKVEASVEQATRPAFFERKLGDLDVEKGGHVVGLTKFFGAYFAAVGERVVRGHGSGQGELSASEAKKILEASGYQSLQGLDRQLVGHMLTRTSPGADSSGRSNSLGYDERSAKHFSGIREELSTLPPEQMKRLDALADRVEGVLAVVQSASDGIYTFEHGRTRIAEPARAWQDESKLPPEEQKAIVDYALRVYDAAADHARALKKAQALYSTSEP